MRRLYGIGYTVTLATSTGEIHSIKIILIINGAFWLEVSFHNKLYTIKTMFVYRELNFGNCKKFQISIENVFSII